MKYFFLTLSFVVFGLSALQLSAQGVKNYPYSSAGYGGLINSFSSRDKMVGAVTANPNILTINTYNPALLLANSATSFEFSLSNDFRTYSNGVASSNVNNLYVDAIKFSFPLKLNKWQTALQIKPMSRVSALSVVNEPIGTDGLYSHEVSQSVGGLNSFSLTNSVKIIKNLNIGVEAGAIIGAIERTSGAYMNFNEVDSVDHWITAPHYLSGTMYQENNSFTGGFVDFGISYVIDPKDSKAQYMLGAKYSGMASLNKKVFAVAETYEKGGFIYRDPITIDTVVENVITKEILPQEFSVGLGILVKDKMSISADYEIRTYNNLTSNRMAVGVERFPTGGKSLIKRSYLSAGMHYRTNAVTYNSFNGNEVGINFGINLPKSSGSKLEPPSLVSLGMNLGTRGTTENGLLRENYIKMSLGLTFNNLWFRKIKIN